MRSVVLSLVVLVGLAGVASAGAITVDGNLSDWQIFLADGNGTVDINGVSTQVGIGASPVTAHPSGSIPGLSGLEYIGEDTDDTRNNYQVGPNYGGQNYDAEYLMAAYDNDYLYVAIASGQRPDNGATLFAPGDLLLTAAQGISPTVFGVEVGGGWGHSTSIDQPGIGQGVAGTTYTLNSNGYTTSANLPTNAQQLAGSLWKDAIFSLDPISPPSPTQLINGNYVGLIDYYFTRDSVGDDHSVIEMAIPRSMIALQGNDYIQYIQWSPSCGNDTLKVEMTTPPTQIVPLPGAIGPGLIGFGMLAIGAWIKRRRNRHEI